MRASDLWDLVAQPDRFRAWWPWLRSFHAPAGFDPGSEWHCVVAPPLPYLVRFTIHVDEVRAPQRVTTHITGDIEGTARLEIAEQSACSSVARITSTLVPYSSALRTVGLVAPHLVNWGHDWVLDQGQSQFVRQTQA